MEGEVMVKSPTLVRDELIETLASRTSSLINHSTISEFEAFTLEVKSDADADEDLLISVQNEDPIEHEKNTVQDDSMVQAEEPQAEETIEPEQKQSSHAAVEEKQVETPNAPPMRKPAKIRLVFGSRNTSARRNDAPVPSGVPPPPDNDFDDPNFEEQATPIPTGMIQYLPAISSVGLSTPTKSELPLVFPQNELLREAQRKYEDRLQIEKREERSTKKIYRELKQQYAQLKNKETFEPTLDKMIERCLGASETGAHDSNQTELMPTLLTNNSGDQSMDASFADDAKQIVSNKSQNSVREQPKVLRYAPKSLYSEAQSTRLSLHGWFGKGVRNLSHAALAEASVSGSFSRLLSAQNTMTAAVDEVGGGEVLAAATSEVSGFKKGSRNRSASLRTDKPRKLKIAAPDEKSLTMNKGTDEKSEKKRSKNDAEDEATLNIRTSVPNAAVIPIRSTYSFADAKELGNPLPLNREKSASKLGSSKRLKRSETALESRGSRKSLRKNIEAAFLTVDDKEAQETTKFVFNMALDREGVSSTQQRITTQAPVSETLYHYVDPFKDVVEHNWVSGDLSEYPILLHTKSAYNSVMAYVQSQYNCGLISGQAVPSVACALAKIQQRSLAPPYGLIPSQTFKYLATSNVQ